MLLLGETLHRTLRSTGRQARHCLALQLPVVKPCAPTAPHSAAVSDEPQLMQVQQINRSDKSINLHTRSNKYGLLKVGQLVQVPARLIKRSNSHFVDTADSMVRLIIGCNGWLWVGMIDQSIVENPNDAVGLHGSTEEEAKDFTPAAEQFEACARYANAALGLARLNLAIYKDSLAEAVKLSVDDEVSCGEMLGMDFLAKLVMLEEARRGGAMDTS